MTTDILDLPGWTVLGRRLDTHEYELEAEYTVQPTACQKCGVVDRLYRHGTKDTIYRDSPIRGHAPASWPAFSATGAGSVERPSCSPWRASRRAAA